MKKTIGALLAAALMTVSANAAVTIPAAVTSTVQAASTAVFNTSAAAVAGTTLIDFDNVGSLLGTAGGFTFTNNNVNLGTLTVLATAAQVVQGNMTNSSAPANDSTKYLAVLAGGWQQMLGTTAFNTMALYWGTPDTFNTIDLLDQGGNSIATITGADVAGLGSLSNSAGLVTLSSNQNFYGAKFSSTSNAFELDNVRFSNASVQAPAGTGTSAVPEPASWAMMIVGFGAVGYASRRRPAGIKALSL